MNYAEIAAINVNEHVEKKGQLSYLSWAWAVDQLQRIDPDASWEFHEPTVFPDGTMMVHCTVQAFGRHRRAFLPVMDYKNRAIANPDAMAVNTAMQRCLAKAIALFGLGLYIYAGEDLPVGSEPTEPAAKETAKAKPPTVAGEAWDNLNPDYQTQLQDIVDCVRVEFGQHGPAAALALLTSETAGMDENLRIAAWGRFDSKERSSMKATKGAK